MKISELQDLQKIANNRTGDYARAEKLDAEKKIATDKITGTVFVPVYFGTGASKGEAANQLAIRRQIRVREAARIIRDSRVDDINVEAYTARDVAWIIGEDRVGMGSCTNFTVCEADPDAACECDISRSSGRGWRRA